MPSRRMGACFALLGVIALHPGGCSLSTPLDGLSGGPAGRGGGEADASTDASEDTGFGGAGGAQGGAGGAAGASETGGAGGGAGSSGTAGAGGSPCAQPGMACQTSSECCSFLCYNGTCDAGGSGGAAGTGGGSAGAGGSPACLPLGSACDPSKADCCEYCCVAQGATCAKAPFEPCTHNGECCSESCVMGYCTVI